jgi:hypothetical protein
MKKTLSSLIILTFLASSFSSCREEKEDNTSIIAAALLLNQRRSSSSGVTTTTGTVTQQRQASTARAGAQGAASAARSSSGRTAYLELKIKENAKNLMAYNIGKLKGKKSNLKDYFTKSNSPKSMLTFATCTDQSSGSCDGSDTQMTFNGSRSCSSGGSMTANNFRVNMSGTTQDALTLTMSGGISYTGCKESAIDFQNYPNTITSTITSGAISISGTYSYSDSTSGTVWSFDEKNDYTVNSTTDMVFTSGSSAVKIENLTSKANLKTTWDINNNYELLGSSGNTLCKGFTACTSVSFATVFGAKYAYVIDGTLAITGKVGGADAGMNLSLSNRTVNYTYTCKK